MAKHKFYKCPFDCDDPYCCYCMGGLAYCVVCEKGEGDLEDECPGVPDEKKINGNPQI